MVSQRFQTQPGSRLRGTRRGGSLLFFTGHAAQCPISLAGRQALRPHGRFPISHVLRVPGAVHGIPQSSGAVEAESLEEKAEGGHLSCVPSVTLIIQLARDLQASL